MFGANKLHRPWTFLQSPINTVVTTTQIMVSQKGVDIRHSSKGRPGRDPDINRWKSIGPRQLGFVWKCCYSCVTVFSPATLWGWPCLGCKKMFCLGAAACKGAKVVWRSITIIITIIYILLWNILQFTLPPHCHIPWVLQRFALLVLDRWYVILLHQYCWNSSPTGLA